MGKLYRVYERLITTKIDIDAIVVLKQECVVGHLPRKFFIRQGGTIEVTVSGARRYSRDLAQGGLEVPCEIKFKIEHTKELEKLKTFMKKYESVV